MGKDLVDEFLRVWTNNHNPNASRNRTNHFMFMYGYERRAESIPLTRFKQQRNLSELADLVKRLTALPLEKLDEELLARAFMTCHSSAEVYRIEAIEKVFGSLEDLEPKTMAELAQRMRANLTGVWRTPAVQQQNKTRRKPKDIEAEMLRGYGVARDVIDRGLTRHPQDWALQLASAALAHDEINYRKSLAPDSKFSENRDEAFAAFAKAAELYAAQRNELSEDEETTKVYELWYYASLGACDLGHISNESVPNLHQPPRIRAAIQALPGEAAERHLAMFANSLFTRMSAAKPAVKFRYLREGFEIVGDHKRAAEARKVFDYYKDLVTEIQLETRIDGSDNVGHGQLFGMFVNLRHTREIERESGGFGRYLQNQNQGGGYYNYGRPLANYRENFEEIVRQALDEHFEVLSVTFEREDVQSRALPEYGWRVTPYAYVLLQARGPEVDKISAVRLDLDFLDTSGYAVIPVESAALPVDAAAEIGPQRPIKNLKIIQTLDERQADEGKLILEVKVTGQGLVPGLDDILDIDSEGFHIVNVEDQGVSIDRFDRESDETVIVSERNWMVTMQAQEDLTELPKSFQFGNPVMEFLEVTQQRYVDADLESVGQVISLEEEYGTANHAWAWSVVAIAALGAVAIGLTVAGMRRRKVHAIQPRFQMPQRVSPFSVLGRLKQIQENNGLTDEGQRQLVTSINRLEHFYFVNGGMSDGNADEAPNLEAIAHDWLRQANR